MICNKRAIDALNSQTRVAILLLPANLLPSSIFFFFFCIIKYLSDPSTHAQIVGGSNDLSLLLFATTLFYRRIYRRIGTISLNDLRIHNGLQFAVKFPPMSTLKVIVVRLAILAPPGFHVIFITVPSRILDHVLVVCRVLAPVFLRRFHLVVSQLQERFEGRFAFVGQVVGDAPIDALREDVVRCHSVHRHAKSDL